MPSISFFHHGCCVVHGWSITSRVPVATTILHSCIQRLCSIHVSTGNTLPMYPTAILNPCIINGNIASTYPTAVLHPCVQRKYSTHVSNGNTQSMYHQRQHSIHVFNGNTPSMCPTAILYPCIQRQYSIHVSSTAIFHPRIQRQYFIHVSNGNIPSMCRTAILLPCVQRQYPIHVSNAERNAPSTPWLIHAVPTSNRHVARQPMALVPRFGPRTVTGSVPQSPMMADRLL